MLHNVIRALRLDRDLYETVENDDSFSIQALAIVVITAVIAGAGGWIGSAEGSLRGAVAEVGNGVIGWLVWSAVTLIIGTRIFDGTSDFGQMTRVLGFAIAPRALFLFGTIGTLIGGLWMMAAGFVAVRQGLDFGALRAVATIVLGLVPAAVLYLLLTAILI